MLQNAYFLAKIGADTAENEQHFAEILPKTGAFAFRPGWARLAWPASPRGAGGVLAVVGEAATFRRRA